MKQGLTGSTLKIIAMISMLIDHFGAAVLGRYLTSVGFLTAIQSENTFLTWKASYGELYLLYWITRGIGRIAFPIFCFLLVEGCYHTKSVKKYGIRMALFALLSEIPFDLAFQNTFLEFTYQNVFFTLTIALVIIAACRKIAESTTKKPLIKCLLQLGCLFLGMVVAQLLHTDYGAFGVFAVWILYLFYGRGKQMLTAGVLTFLWEVTAPFAFVPIKYYNGKRGISLKYFFYLFYPLHILLLYLLCVMLGISGNEAL